MTKEELIRKFENTDKNEVAEIARRLFCDIVSGIKADTGDQEFAFNFAVAILANVIAADDKMNVDEYALFAYIIGSENPDPNDVFNFLKQFVDYDILSNINQLIDSNQNLKIDVCTFAFAVAAIDGHVSYDENKLLSYLVE